MKRTIPLLGIFIMLVPSIKASIGKDMMGGLATGTVALGALRVAQEQKKITEQQAMAIAALTGLTATAIIQAQLAESSLIDVVAHIATAMVTFNLMHFLAAEFITQEAEQPVAAGA